MNPQFWWYVARAAGIVGWLFLTAAVLWGIMLSTKLFPDTVAPHGCSISIGRSAAWRC